MKKSILLLALLLCICCLTFFSCTKNGESGETQNTDIVTDTVTDTDIEQNESVATEEDTSIDAGKDAVVDDPHSSVAPEELG